LGISKNIPLTFSPCNGEIRVRLKKDVFRDTQMDSVKTGMFQRYYPNGEVRKK
jgi:hypothetical protein